MGTLLEYVLDVVTALIVLRVLYGALRQFFRAPRPGAAWRHSSQGGHSADSRGRPAAKPMARDPVCGTFVSTDVSRRLRQNGETLHFCSQECLEAYERQKPVGSKQQV